ncbi:MAG TPA: right-handed parallel beta-helix repeat-containing protein, partial [Solirubrobacterales bacterium]|nr:right-handed parallel beta-helix repeat-containing protein [Solirubrobacterales bacterium]
MLLLVAAAAFGAGIVVSADEPAGTPASAGATGPREGAAEIDCDEVLAVGGDAAAFASALRSGETGCLRGGVHELDEVATIGEPGVVLTSFPGESATLAGRLWIETGADGTRVENLILDGRNPEGKPSPTINADDVVLRGNDIANGHTAICVSVNNYRDDAPPRGVVIENNAIHDCGLLPATNHHHGIYIANARDTVVRDNLIYGNADRGVQLYPDADDSVVTGNVIDGNGQGVIFGGGPDSSSD